MAVEENVHIINIIIWQLMIFVRGALNLLKNTSINIKNKIKIKQERSDKYGKETI